MNTSKLLVERIGLFPSSGNIQVEVHDSSHVVERLQVLYADYSLDSDASGAGFSMVFADWRFKLQVSDPLSVCLCVESRGDSQFMQVKTAELLANICGTEERP
ncbi:phosphomannomutase [Pseudomonas marginalis]|jgi:phosphomannomutase|uniref:phosphomannomutase n=1 Tax=Pseudomonas marginalis TaxID=298 RepID=UPI00247FF115|nr:phosphomannomutase [Pseudomonas marginalis]WGT26054.1 phosphomannomutase [Pseudomonas marginalis]